MSRVNGWLTVTPNKMSRTKPLEKESPTNNPMGSVATDQNDISKLSPTWMQRNQERGRAIVKKHQFEVADTIRSVPSIVLKGEGSRIFMVDKQQPSRSVFSIGDARHNVQHKGIPQAVATKTGSIDLNPRRIEWYEKGFQGKEGGRGFAALQR